MSKWEAIGLASIFFVCMAPAIISAYQDTEVKKECLRAVAAGHGTIAECK